MRLILEIDTDNDAFSDDTNREAARIIRHAAEGVELGQVAFDGTKRRLRDINGNSVGWIFYTDEE